MAQPRLFSQRLALAGVALALWHSCSSLSAFCGQLVRPSIGTFKSSSTGRPSVASLQAYAPKTVQEAWDNHFTAFGDQDVDKILLDYDEKSKVILYNHADGSQHVYKGTAQIGAMFEDLFDGLSDLETLEAPVIEVEETSDGGGMVFLVWKCPGCGFESATDTFVFGPDKKIKFQNVVVTEYLVE
eukprot:gb/GFBE01061544.1/.p1 GENE.gb/GFBE01061544.1/~~gb/GFBE01061544.1/.p1  ORF type:complete len:185 (+),score=51.42 gb/GFBE01061544.1/:1-555(+)